MKITTLNFRNFFGLYVIIQISFFQIACTPSPTTEICSNLNSTIDHNIMEIALSEVEGDTSDKSAIQQTARLTQNNNRLSTILINIELANQNKCSPRNSPIDASIYQSQASACYLARLQQVSAMYDTDISKKENAKIKVAEVCNFSTWNTQNKINLSK